MANSVKIAFIGSELRSGSTLLDIALGQLPSVHSCGEIRSIWYEALSENPLCGCGRPFLECTFWSAVGARAYGGWDARPALKALKLARSLDRLRMIPLLLTHQRWPALRQKVDAFAESLSRLYLAIRDISGASVIVDSSKYPSTAMLLSLAPSADLRLIHLVRDSRGVAYSWTKKIVKPDTGRPMPTQAPFATAARWVYINSMLNLLRSSGIPAVLLRYESLVQTPKEALLNILKILDEQRLRSHVEEIVVGDTLVVHKPAHIIGGNYSKMKKAPTIRLDDEWRTRMPLREKATVTILTSPLLWRYGYFSLSGSPLPTRHDASR